MLSMIGSQRYQLHLRVLHCGWIYFSFVDRKRQRWKWISGDPKHPHEQALLL